MTLVSAVIMIFLVLDPFGNIPFILALLKNFSDKEYKKIISRELIFAFIILLIFLLCGKYILHVLHLSEEALSIAGGVILFMISIKMIFSGSELIFEGNQDTREPFIVPIAIPSFAGPSAMTTVMLLMANYPDQWTEWLLALSIAFASAGIILYYSRILGHMLGKKGLSALDRLMGMILTTIAIEMLISGIKGIVQSMK